MTSRSPERGEAAGYLPELDGLRAFAILLVIAYHVWDYRGANPVGRAMNVLVREGWVGVDVFFALSGFLITRILRASRASPRYFRSFYIRRSLRIFPLYYAVLALLTVIGVVAAAKGIVLPEPSPDQLRRSWLNFLYLSNFALAFLGSNAIPLDISWSLAVEEQFYLVYPLVVRRLERSTLERWLVVAIVAAIPLRWLSFRWFPGTHYGPYALPYCRMDALAVGGLAALVLERPDRALAHLLARAALPLWIAAIAVAFTWHRGLTPFVLFGYTLTAAATAATILRLQLNEWAPLRALLRWRVLVGIGKVSYGLYLLHLFVRAGVDRLPWFTAAHRDDLGIAALRAGLMVAGSLAVAWCSWVVFESPILRLKARFDAPPERALRP